MDFCMTYSTTRRDRSSIRFFAGCNPGKNGTVAAMAPWKTGAYAKGWAGPPTHWEGEELANAHQRQQ